MVGLLPDQIDFLNHTVATVVAHSHRHNDFWTSVLARPSGKLVFDSSQAANQALFI